MDINDFLVDLKSACDENYNFKFDDKFLDLYKIKDVYKDKIRGINFNREPFEYLLCTNKKIYIKTNIKEFNEFLCLKLSDHKDFSIFITKEDTIIEELDKHIIGYNEYLKKNIADSNLFIILHCLSTKESSMIIEKIERSLKNYFDKFKFIPYLHFNETLLSEYNQHLS